jgi:hypothetical protein
MHALEQQPADSAFSSSISSDAAEFHLVKDVRLGLEMHWDAFRDVQWT